MRQLFFCILSGAAGALITIWFSVPRIGELRAQGPNQGPGLAAPGATAPTFTGPTIPRPDEAKTPLSAEEAIAVAVYELANRSVVNITTRSIRTDGFFLLEESSEGSGSGVILDKTGHILTNFHVLEGARDVSVTLFNGKSYEAEYVGSDAINDLAIIRIEAEKDVLFPIGLGDSGELQVGMRVFAIGNPFGLERTMTTGIISSLNRSLAIRNNRTIRSIIQIDASINPGNSGGPLLDKNGRLIGINTAIASKTGQSSGVGFAIPVNLVKRVTPQLIKFGKVIRPEVGIQRVYETDAGLLVARLTPDGPAERAGLRGPARSRRGPFLVIDRSAADLILKVDGKPVKTADDFLNQIESHRPGDKVVLTIRRGEKTLQVDIALSSDE